MKIIPAILSHNKGDFQSKLIGLSRLSKELQIDICDDVFTDGNTLSINNIGIDIDINNIDIIFHLMLVSPMQDLHKFMRLNPKKVIIHAESKVDWLEIIKLIPRHQLGLAINPETDVDEITDKLMQVSEVLVMTVNPGQQKQGMITEPLGKIPLLKNLSKDILVSVDGGVNKHTIVQVYDAGCDIAYVGSALTESGDAKKTYNGLLSIIEG